MKSYSSPDKELVTFQCTERISLSLYSLQGMGNFLPRVTTHKLLNIVHFWSTCIRRVMEWLEKGVLTHLNSPALTCGVTYLWPIIYGVAHGRCCSLHRRSQGVQWVHAPAPPGRWKKFFRRNLQGKCVSAPQDTKCTPARGRVNFRTFFAGRVRFGGIFRPSFEGDD